MHDIWEECVVNEQDIRDEVDRLVEFMQPYFPLFGRAESGTDQIGGCELYS